MFGRRFPRSTRNRSSMYGRGRPIRRSRRQSSQNQDRQPNSRRSQLSTQYIRPYKKPTSYGGRAGVSSGRQAIAASMTPDLVTPRPMPKPEPIKETKTYTPRKRMSRPEPIKETKTYTPRVKRMSEGGMATKNAKGHNDYRKTGTTLSVKDNRKK